MLFELDPTQFSRLRGLVQPLHHHLAVTAVLEDHASGRVWVDDPLAPQSALLQIQHRFYLAGRADNPGWISALRGLFMDELLPLGRQQGEVEFGLHYDGAEWEPAILAFLAEHEPIFSRRKYFEFQRLRDLAWRERIPEGMAIQPVDAQLLGGEALDHLDELRSETTSETPATAYFLENRFGFCLRNANAIAGWCLSEYNWAGRCEVGIETAAEYRRQGVGLLTASALVEHALEQGIAQIGWDCWANNLASARTALKVGFEEKADYAAAFAWFDLPSNLAVHGSVSFEAGRLVEAREWFERAFQSGQPPLWAQVVAAFTCCRLGERAAALAHLRSALDGGFTGLDWIRTSEHLQDLHATREWQDWLGG